MKIYAVGGSVRDEMLGLPVRERDWVVVGARPQELLDMGYKPVGKDFPVFLHPRTSEEYALARTERKTAPGYRGFEIDADPGVTLQQDLLRRDLTINAMARDPDGVLIDPYGGRNDLEARLLRHVSPAFGEDPVRLLRVARFAARYAALGFTVAPETMQLLRAMCAGGEVDALVPERVWQETRKALATERPDRFVEVLREAGALARIFPEIDRLFGVPQPEHWHPEIDTGVHTLMALKMIATLSEDLRARFAVLVHDLGKGTTPVDILPSHRGHEKRGVELIEALCKRLRIPKDFCQTAVAVARFHTHLHKAQELRPRTLLRVLTELDAFRRPERLQSFLVACEADARGRLGLEERPYPQAEYFAACYRAAAAVDAGAIAQACEHPRQIPERIHAARVAAIRKVVRTS